MQHQQPATCVVVEPLCQADDPGSLGGARDVQLEAMGTVRRGREGIQLREQWPEQAAQFFIRFVVQKPMDGAVGGRDLAIGAQDQERGRIRVAHFCAQAFELACY